MGVSPGHQSGRTEIETESGVKPEVVARSADQDGVRVQVGSVSDFRIQVR